MRRVFLFTGILVILVFAFAISSLWCSAKDASATDRNPKSLYYFGLTQKPVYSKSVVDSPRSRYVFEPVLQFDQVTHDFIVKNNTKNMLEFKKVEGCCGSLVEAFSDQIPPGKEGVIKVILFTDRRGGEEINGVIRAMTNDPKNPIWTIDITCFVKKFADISAYTIMLDGSWRSTIEGTSSIIPTADYPFKITSLKAKRGIFITYGYKEISQAGKKGYLVWAKNIRKEPGIIRDSIYIQTNNPARPQFMIRVQGKLTD